MGVKSPIHLAFVGGLAPDEIGAGNIAFSQAGNQCQMNLIKSIHQAGINVSGIIARYPVPLFPRGKMLWVKGTPLSICDVGAVHFAPFVNLPFLREVTISLSVINALRSWSRTIPKESEKVVLMYNLTCPPGIAVAGGARLIGAKAAACIHDIHVPGKTCSDNAATRLKFMLQKQAIPLFDGLMVASKDIVNDFAPDITWILFPPGVDRAVLSQFSSIERHSSASRKQFIMVAAGALSEINGIREIIGAMRYLDGEHYCLRIAGRGPLEPYVRQAALRDRRIEYCGYLSHEETLNLYKTADILINMRLTSTFNARYFFPSKLVEYMATGVPVVSTELDQIKGECDRMLFLIKDETSEALANMIAYVESLNREERVRVGTFAAEWVGSNLAWDILGRRAAEFICTLVE